ncbi:MAG: hypothetical protein RLZZ424_824, partial [Bacteroidota bacterium]
LGGEYYFEKRDQDWIKWFREYWNESRGLWEPIHRTYIKQYYR